MISPLGAVRLGCRLHPLRSPRRVTASRRCEANPNPNPNPNANPNPNPNPNANPNPNPNPHPKPKPNPNQVAYGPGDLRVKAWILWWLPGQTHMLPRLLT